MVTFAAAVVRPLPLTVTCATCVALPHVPVLLLTVASVAACEPEPGPAVTSPVSAVMPPPPPVDDITPLVIVIVVPSGLTKPSTEVVAVGIEAFAAAVSRPFASTVNVATCVVDPYDPAVTAVVARVAATEPEPEAVTSPVSAVMPPPDDEITPPEMVMVVPSGLTRPSTEVVAVGICVMT